MGRSRKMVKKFDFDSYYKRRPVGRAGAVSRCGTPFPPGISCPASTSPKFNYMRQYNSMVIKTTSPYAYKINSTVILDRICLCLLESKP